MLTKCGGLGLDTTFIQILSYVGHISCEQTRLLVLFTHFAPNSKLVTGFAGYVSEEALVTS